MNEVKRAIIMAAGIGKTDAAGYTADTKTSGKSKWG